MSGWGGVVERPRRAAPVTPLTAAAAVILSVPLPDDQVTVATAKVKARHLGVRAEGSLDFTLADNNDFPAFAMAASVWLEAMAGAAVPAGGTAEVELDDGVKPPIVIFLDVDDSRAPVAGEYEVVPLIGDTATQVRDKVSAKIAEASAAGDIDLTTEDAGAVKTNVAHVKSGVAGNGLGAVTANAAWVTALGVATGGAFAGGSNGGPLVLDDTVNAPVSFLCTETPTSYVTGMVLVDASGFADFTDAVAGLRAAIEAEHAAGRLDYASSISGADLILNLRNDNHGTVGNGAGKITSPFTANVVVTAMAGGAARDDSGAKDVVWPRLAAGASMDAGVGVQLGAADAAGTLGADEPLPAGTALAAYLNVAAGALRAVVVPDTATDAYQCDASIILG